MADIDKMTVYCQIDTVCSLPQFSCTKLISSNLHFFSLPPAIVISTLSLRLASTETNTTTHREAPAQTHRNCPWIKKEIRYMSLFLMMIAIPLAPQMWMKISLITLFFFFVDVASGHSNGCQGSFD